MFDVSREEITEGSIPRALLVLAAPLVAQNFALVAQQVVDIFWVGRLGESAVAAVGLVVPLVALLAVPLRVFYTGGQVLTSQRVGSDDAAGANRIPVNAAFLAVVVAAVIAVAVVFLARPLVELLNPSTRVAKQATIYLTGYAFARVPAAFSDSLEGGLIGWGDSRASLIVNLVAIAANVILDPLLILGLGPFPDWGVFGAAMATGIGWGLGGLVALWFAAGDYSDFDVTRESLSLDVDLWPEIAEVGGPIAVQAAGRQVARLFVVAIVSTVGGAAALAAYTIGARVATVAFVPAQGVAQASTSIVGQNLGADLPDRARRATWTGVAVAAVGLSAFGVVQWLFPTTIAQVFVPNISGDGLQFTVRYLQILAYGYWALGAIYTVEAGFNGASRTKVSMYSTLIQYWLVRLPIAAGGAFLLGMGVEAVFWGVTLSNVAAAVGLAAYYWYSTSEGMLERAAARAGDATAD